MTEEQFLETCRILSDPTNQPLLTDTQELALRRTTGRTPKGTLRKMAFAINPDFFYLLDSKDKQELIREIKEKGTLGCYRPETNQGLPYNIEQAFW